MLKIVRVSNKLVRNCWGYSSWKLSMTVNSYVFRILIGFTTVNIIILPALVVYWRARRVALVEPSFCFPEDVLSSGNPNLLKQLIELNDKNTDRNTQCDKLSDVLKEIVKQKTANRYNSNLCPEYLPLNLQQFNCINTIREEVMMHLKQLHLMESLFKERQQKYSGG